MISDKPVVLITGGGQRLGLHCARRLAGEGYRVLITCRRRRPDWEFTSPREIEVMEADFSSVSGIEEFIHSLKNRKLKLRAIIHNASQWIGDDLEPDTFQSLFCVHMQAPFMINRACRDMFVPGEHADIIHMTDYVAGHGSMHHSAYAATKAGLESLTQSFAKQYAPEVKVNSIAPFLIMFNEGDSDDYRAQSLEKSALGIEPGPEVIYRAVRYLMDNIYVTGECLKLDGGRHL